MRGKIYFKNDDDNYMCETQCPNLKNSKKFVGVGSMTCKEDCPFFEEKDKDEKGQYVICRAKPGRIKSFFVLLAEWIIVRILMRGLRFGFVKIITFLEWIKR